VFLPNTEPDEPFELPQSELDKLRKVLRLGTGDRFAVLPNDGSLIVCRLQGRQAYPECVEHPRTEPRVKVTLVQALPKADRLEAVVRMGTEVGIARFVLFTAERSVVKWEPAKLGAKLSRLRAIAREAAEQSFRVRLPEIESLSDLGSVLEGFPDALVLSELEDVALSLKEAALPNLDSGTVSLVAGPEGGWSPRELSMIGERGVTMGPRVLRTDTAGVAAAAAILIGMEP
jgi:16S rRNA (uracil1498-N3)-methyltransferase